MLYFLVIWFSLVVLVMGWLIAFFLTHQNR